MEISEMEENGSIDNYLELKNFIRQFIDNNYPLSQEDLRSIIEDRPTENVLKRRQTYDILKEALEIVLQKVVKRNTDIIEGAKKGEYTSFTTKELEQELLQQKREMLAILWEKQYGGDHILTEIEAFSLVENDPKKVVLFAKFYHMRQQVEKGELTEEKLKFLCDTAFGKDSIESKEIYEAMIQTGKMKQRKNEDLER